MTEKHRLILSLVVVLLATAALGTVWGFGYRSERALDNESEGLESRLKQAQADLDGLDSLERRHRESLEQANFLAGQIPAEEDREGVFEILQQTKRQAGQSGGGEEFTIHVGKKVDDKVKAMRKALPTTHEEGTLELTVAGTWAGFISFLDGLEHADRLIAVKSFKTEAPSKEDPLTYQYRLTLSYYWLKAPAPSGRP